MQPAAHNGDVNCVAWRPQPAQPTPEAATPEAASAGSGALVGRLLASAGDDGMVRIWQSAEARLELVD